MKLTYLFAQLILLFLTIGCQSSKTEKNVEKFWQGYPIDFMQIREVVNTYHMFDSTKTKVGSMVFGFSFEEGFLVARDTSQFDDGRVYETAMLTFDTSSFQMKQIAIDMSTQRASLDIDLQQAGENVQGSYLIKQDTSRTIYEIDSAYRFSAFREEIYIMTHTLGLNPGDTVSIQTLVPTSMSISNAQLIYAGEETLVTLNGTQTCDVIWLKADGKMPDNKIWVTKKSPRTIVKFYVPGPELSIELVKQR